MIIDIPALKLVTDIFAVIALVLTIVSLVDYMVKNIRVITEGGM